MYRYVLYTHAHTYTHFSKHSRQHSGQSDIYRQTEQTEQTAQTGRHKRHTHRGAAISLCKHQRARRTSPLVFRHLCRDASLPCYCLCCRQDSTTRYLKLFGAPNGCGFFFVFWKEFHISKVAHNAHSNWTACVLCFRCVRVCMSVICAYTYAYTYTNTYPCPYPYPYTYPYRHVLYVGISATDQKKRG